MYGVRRLFAAGVSIFALGSLLCALAQDYPVLMGARLIQAAGAASLSGLAPAAVSLAYAPGRRGSALGMIGVAVGTSAAIGPTLGGFITDALGWQYLFGVSALAGTLAPFALRILPEGETSTDRRFDWLGGSLLGLAIAGSLLTLTQGAKSGWGETSVIVYAISTLLAAAGLVWRQSKARSPFIPGALLRNRLYRGLIAMSFGLIGINITIEFALPLLLTDLNGLTPTLIGLALLPAALALAASGPLAGRMADLFGASVPIFWGLISVIAALFAMSTFGVGASVWVVILLAAIINVGATFAKIAISTSLSMTVNRENLSSGLALGEMSFLLGASFGTALFSTTLDARAFADRAINPLYVADGTGYSDAFLILMAPMLIVFLISLTLTRIRPKTNSGTSRTAPETLHSDKTPRH